MNWKQKILSWAALFLFILSVLFAPWQVDFKNSNGHVTTSRFEISPVFLPPAPSSGVYQVNLKWPGVVFTWGTIGIIYGGIFHLLKPKLKRQAFGKDVAN